MELKKYQQKTLAILKEYLNEARILGAKEAYEKVTEPFDIRTRLGALRGYKELSDLPNTPRVCLKVPTGGGKTILGAYSLRIIADSWSDCENPVVLWFCPSDTIRKQTAEALKNPRHAYRKVIDEQFGGRVRVFDLDEKFDIRPADLSQNLCIIVSTMQSFRQSNTDKYNVYKHNENLEPHFSTIRKEDGMELHEDGTLKFSFANLLRHYRPVIIVDEAHKAVTDLSKEMHSRLNPSIILELTATPYTKNNTLYNVTALELKDEEMIKIPIVLDACGDWEKAIQLTIHQQKFLEVQAEREREYLRPIALIQAQSKQKGVELRLIPELIREHLMTVHNIPEGQIAIVTGEQKELDNIDLFQPSCQIRFVITVEALKEGWDCPFAYILCSVSNIKSNTAIQQLLGRVMRMPYARKRTLSKLNKSYAFVMSPSFSEAAQDIISCLNENGFDEQVAADCVEQVAREDLIKELGYYSSGISLTLAEAEQVEETEHVKLEDDGKGGKTIFLTIEATESEVNKVAERLPEQKRKQAKEVADTLRRNRENYIQNLKPAPKSPAELGEKLIVPRLLTELQGELVPAELDYMVEVFPWDINDFAEVDIPPQSIAPDSNGTVVEIDIVGDPINRQKLVYSNNQGQQMILNLESVQPEGWTEATLVNWLDRKVRQNDINQAQMLKWLSAVVHRLVVNYGLSIARLMMAKYSLANRLNFEIRRARQKMKKTAYQLSLFGQTSRVEVDFEQGFEFREGMYDDDLAYNGSFVFRKHFLPKVPRFDGPEDGEEFECAKMLDSLPEVQYWIRNKAGHPSSFHLPTASDRFYPDFIAKLTDGRILVVEYKGEHLISNADTAEKNTIGQLWEYHSKGAGLFMIAHGARRQAQFKQMFMEKITR